MAKVHNIENGSMERGNPATARDVKPALTEGNCTVKGCEMEGSAALKKWQKCVRRAVCFVMPGGKYQTRIVDEAEAEKAPRRVSVAGGKEVHVQNGVKYEVDDFIDSYNCKPPTLFIPIITIVQLVVFIAYAVEQASRGIETTAISGVPLYSPLVYDPYRRYEVWRFFSYMFIHQGYIHLGFNLLVQLILGVPMEMVHKWWRMAIIYLFGVAAGSAGHAVFDRYTFLVGASGGVYALIGAHLAVIVMNWKEMTHDWMSSCDKFFASAPVRLVIWILVVGGDIGFALYTRYFMKEDTNIGYAAHFGGALVGFLIGIPVVRNIEKKPWEEVLFYIALVIFVLLLIFAIFWNIFYPDYPPTDWRTCCVFTYDNEGELIE